MAGSVPTGLVEAAQSGGRAEIERLLQTIWPDAYRLAFAVLGDRQSAEDAAQEGCVHRYLACPVDVAAALAGRRRAALLRGSSKPGNRFDSTDTRWRRALPTHGC